MAEEFLPSVTFVSEANRLSLNFDIRIFSEATDLILYCNNVAFKRKLTIHLFVSPAFDALPVVFPRFPEKLSAP